MYHACHVSSSFLLCNGFLSCCGTSVGIITRHHDFIWYISLLDVYHITSLFGLTTYWFYLLLIWNILKFIYELCSLYIVTVNLFLLGISFFKLPPLTIYLYGLNTTLVIFLSWSMLSSLSLLFPNGSYVEHIIFILECRLLLIILLIDSGNML